MNQSAFTLMEMLVVISLAGLLSALATSAISGIEGAGNFNMAVSQVGGVLEQARAYAMAKNTFVYVGFTEVQAPQAGTGSTSGNGCVVVVAMATRDGTRGFDANSSDPAGSWSSNYNNGSNLLLVNKPLYVNNLHLPAQQEASTANMARPALSSSSDLINGPSIQSETPLAYPLGSPLTGGQYTFNRVIYFDPTGASHMQLPTTTSGEIDPYLEVDLQPTHGTSVQSTAANLAAIQIDGMTGAIRVYRP